MYELSKIIFMAIVILVFGGIEYMSLPSIKKPSPKRRETPVFMVIKAEN